MRAELRRAGRWVWGRLGRRGVVLLALGVLDVEYAYSLAGPGGPGRGGQRASAAVLFLGSAVPLPVWAVVWAAAGVVCVVFAWARRDRVGYAAAIAVKILWGCQEALGAVFSGVSRAWVSAAIWLALAVIIAVVASWPEPGGDG